MFSLLDDKKQTLNLVKDFGTEFRKPICLKKGHLEQPKSFSMLDSTTTVKDIHGLSLMKIYSSFII